MLKSIITIEEVREKEQGAVDDKLTVIIKFDFEPQLPESKPRIIPKDMLLMMRMTSTLREIATNSAVLAALSGLKVNTDKNRLLHKCVLTMEAVQVGERLAVTLLSEFNPPSPMLTDGTYTPVECIIVMFAKFISQDGSLIPLGDEENEVDLSE